MHFSHAGMSYEKFILVTHENKTLKMIPRIATFDKPDA